MRIEIEVKIEVVSSLLLLLGAGVCRQAGRSISGCGRDEGPYDQ
jgi:hypothetical protein